MSLVRRFYPKRLTYSVLWTIPRGAIWGEVACPGTQRHAGCSGVWTCDPLIPTPTHNPLRHTPLNHCEIPHAAFVMSSVWCWKTLNSHINMHIYCRSLLKITYFMTIVVSFYLLTRTMCMWMFFPLKRPMLMSHMLNKVKETVLLFHSVQR